MSLSCFRGDVGVRFPFQGLGFKPTGLGLITLALIGISAAGHSSASSPTDVSNWTSIVIAADWRDGQGKAIEAFDNAQRDIASGLLQRGFSPSHQASLSLNPTKPDRVSPLEAMERIRSLGQVQTSGCLFYLTSHGTPANITFGDTEGLKPVDMAALLRMGCGNRPTVVVLSACFSGSFIDALKAPNRMIMTAARRDRTSFGCGEGEVYPWFDACVIEHLATATHFLDLAAETRACVTRREGEAQVELPSEPQVFIGAEMQIRLPLVHFAPITP